MLEMIYRQASDKHSSTTQDYLKHFGIESLRGFSCPTNDAHANMFLYLKEASRLPYPAGYKVHSCIRCFFGGGGGVVRIGL